MTTAPFQNKLKLGRFPRRELWALVFYRKQPRFAGDPTLEVILAEDLFVSHIGTAPNGMKDVHYSYEEGRRLRLHLEPTRDAVAHRGAFKEWAKKVMTDRRYKVYKFQRIRGLRSRGALLWKTQEINVNRGRIWPPTLGKNTGDIHDDIGYAFVVTISALDACVTSVLGALGVDGKNFRVISRRINSELQALLTPWKERGY